MTMTKQHAEALALGKTAMDTIESELGEHDPLAAAAMIRVAVRCCHRVDAVALMPSRCCRRVDAVALLPSRCCGRMLTGVTRPPSTPGMVRRGLACRDLTV